MSHPFNVTLTTSVLSHMAENMKANSKLSGESAWFPSHPARPPARLYLLLSPGCSVCPCPPDHLLPRLPLFQCPGHHRLPRGDSLTLGGIPSLGCSWGHNLRLHTALYCILLLISSSYWIVDFLKAKPCLAHFDNTHSSEHSGLHMAGPEFVS